MKTKILTPFQNGAQGIVHIPGSKSITNRCLLLSALANGESTLVGGLESDDAVVMQNALVELGVEIKKKKGVWKVKGKGGVFKEGNHNIYLGNAGTAVRFLTAVTGLCLGNIRLHGKERMHQRPILDLIFALQELGVNIQSECDNGCPPVIISGFGEIEGGNCKILGQISSQFLSALLQIAPLTKKGIRIQIIPPLVSRPYLEMTLSLLKKYNVNVKKISELEYEVLPQKILPVRITIEADASSSAHVFSLAVASKGSVTIANFPKESIQGDAKFLHILEKFGADITSSSTGTTVEMRREIKPLGEIDMEDVPDTALSAVVLAVLAKGKTKITGLSTLRNKECDRIEVLCNNLKKMGADVHEGKDFIEINGNPDTLHGAEIQTYDDHRIAMSFAALGTRISGIEILDPQCVEKTFPTFWDTFDSLQG